MIVGPGAWVDWNLLRVIPLVPILCKRVIDVPFGEWEKIPRLQAKTLVSFWHGADDILWPVVEMLRMK